MKTILIALTQVTLGLNSMSYYSPVEVQSVKLPLYGMYGGAAALECHYTSVQPVYSVKWYKNGKEFYSYLPGKPDPITIHDVEGITLDRQRQSNEYTVYLSHLSQASTGRYRCEVSEEGPMFATDSAYADLLVVVTPQNGPSISGHGNKRYSVGETLDLNCSSEATLPPANLTWYINQRPVSPEQLIKYPIINMTVAKDETLHTAILGLRHTIQRSDFGHGKIVTVKCVASIYDIYYKMVETRILRDKKNRRIIKMDKNKVDNNKYTYNIVDGEYSDNEDIPKTEDKAKLFLFNKSNFLHVSFLLQLFVLASLNVFSILI